jgi:cytoplasmic iron level regulating protein YaaA (DUF328/UPF0246 family)
MLIVLSPAKSLDLETPPTTKLHSNPTSRSFRPADRPPARIVAAELGELMDLSDNLSALNVARYASWSRDTSEGRQAVMASMATSTTASMRAA